MKQRGIWFGTLIACEDYESVATTNHRETEAMVIAASAKAAREMIVDAGFREESARLFRDYWSKVDTHTDAEGKPDGLYLRKPHERGAYQLAQDVRKGGAK